jgi:cystathionine beta-lyase
MAPVEGTYLLWLDMNAFPLRGMALVRYLAKEAKIGVINGRMFGPSGDGFIRINVALPRAEMLQALTQFCDSLNQIPPLEN